MVSLTLDIWQVWLGIVGAIIWLTTMSLMLKIQIKQIDKLFQKIESLESKIDKFRDEYVSTKRLDEIVNGISERIERHKQNNIDHIESLRREILRTGVTL